MLVFFFAILFYFTVTRTWKLRKHAVRVPFITKNATALVENVLHMLADRKVITENVREGPHFNHSSLGTVSEMVPHSRDWLSAMYMYATRCPWLHVKRYNSFITYLYAYVCVYIYSRKKRSETKWRRYNIKPALQRSDGRRIRGRWKIKYTFFLNVFICFILIVF